MYFMNSEKELTGREADAYETGRKDELDLDISKTSSEEQAKERGQEDRIDAEASREEQESDEE
jgi:hypothetical protein